MNCKNQKFGHNYAGGICLNCQGSQKTFGELYKKSRKEIKPDFRKHKIDYEFQELGIEINQQIKGNIWWLFYKYPIGKIRQAYKVCQERGIYNLAFLIGVLKKI